MAVVDDDPEVRSALARVLLGFGYEVETFDSAMTFFNCASTCQANCLVVDVEMSENSGIDLAHALAADGYEFPIIFMSGRTDVTVRKRALAAGGVAFLPKPFPAEVLLATIKKAAEWD